MPRPPRLAVAGGIYHVTARGNNREPIYSDDTDLYVYFALLVEMMRFAGVRVLAYVLIPNHVHLLMQTAAANISAAIHRLHGPYANYYNRRHGHTGHVFERRFHSSLVEDDVYLLAITCYIHRNPVRAGLVSHPEDYPWSSFRCYVDPKSDQSVVDVRPVLELISTDLSKSRLAYASLVRDAVDRVSDSRSLGKVRSSTANPPKSTVV